MAYLQKAISAYVKTEYATFSALSVKCIYREILLRFLFVVSLCGKPRTCNVRVRALYIFYSGFYVPDSE